MAPMATMNFPRRENLESIQVRVDENIMERVCLPAVVRVRGGRVVLPKGNIVLIVCLIIS